MVQFPLVGSIRKGGGGGKRVAELVGSIKKGGGKRVAELIGIVFGHLVCIINI